MTKQRVNDGERKFSKFNKWGTSVKLAPHPHYKNRIISKTIGWTNEKKIMENYGQTKGKRCTQVEFGDLGGQKPFFSKLTNERTNHFLE